VTAQHSSVRRVQRTQLQNEIIFKNETLHDTTSKKLFVSKYTLFKHCLNNLELPYQLVKTILGPLLFDLIHVNYFNIVFNV
jgi:hypothetical protein